MWENYVEQPTDVIAPNGDFEEFFSQIPKTVRFRNYIHV